MTIMGAASGGERGTAGLSTPHSLLQAEGNAPVEMTEPYVEMTELYVEMTELYVEMTGCEKNVSSEVAFGF
jgi:hypothetical protein